MGIAITLDRYLKEHDVAYDVCPHNHTSTSMETAQAAHIPGDRVAKSVVLEDDKGYLMAVLPATHRLDLGELHRQTNRRLGLATETELRGLFDDCEVGAIPPIGSAYGMDVLVDHSLAEQTDVYFDAGDHEQLIHVSGETFANLLGEAQYGHFSRHR